MGRRGQGTFVSSDLPSLPPDGKLEISSGTVTALVGPNGAGKTTLLHLAVGLNRATDGEVHVFGHSPRGDAAQVPPCVGFVAQEHLLYRGFTIGETLKLGRTLNPSWDDAVALQRIERLGLCLGQKVGKLSGGEQAQVALTLALAKQPELLVLDEPIASLDPLARREFLQTVMQAVVETRMTVILSSHIVADLERVCDHLVILAAGRVQLAGSIEEIVASHRLLTGPRDDPASVARVHELIRESHTERRNRARTHPLRRLVDTPTRKLRGSHRMSPRRLGVMEDCEAAGGRSR